MSKILSPHPPFRIEITIDRQTGVTNCMLKDSVPFPVLIDAFASLIITYNRQAVAAAAQMGLKPNLSVVPENGEQKNAT